MTSGQCGIEDIEVLIIGAGINGAGVFRDLCEQGVTCAIIDKSDFGSGTSAAPSRLIHGGIKYLETGELGLVAQSTLERNLLLKNAPHYVTPLPTVIPIFSWLKGIPSAIRTLFGSTTAPRSRGAVLIKIGLSMYDFYGARQRVMPRHALWSKSKALKNIPPLTPRIVAAGTYYDAKVSHPERLVLELVMDGLKANPMSLALNYATIEGTDGSMISVRDSAGTLKTFKPCIVINAAGPWIDKVNAALGEPTRLIGGTKGSHILIDHPELIKALDGRMIYFEADDGRICLVFDYLGKALVGSTDIRATDPDNVVCDDTEIEYFLDSMASLFPSLSFARDQIVYTYSGIRPLPASDASKPGLISRDHSAPVIEASENHRWPIISLVGGKWTTFRGFAEEVSDTALSRLGRQRRVSTQNLAIGGGLDFPIENQRAVWIRDVSNMTRADPERAELLLGRYGSKAIEILKSESSEPRKLHDVPDYSEQEINWIVRSEMVVRLEDLIMRRTSLAITGSISLDGVRQIADITGIELDWSEQKKNSYIDILIKSLYITNRAIIKH